MADEIGKGEARAVGALTAFFGDLLDEGGGVAAWLGIPGSDFGGTTRKERYLRARDAFRDQVKKVQEARRSEFKEGRIGGTVAQALATGPLVRLAGLAKWGGQVAVGMVQGAANRIGAEQSLEGTLATGETLLKEGGTGALIGGAGAGAGQVLANAPAVVGAVGRAAGKVADSAPGRSAKAVAGFVDDLSPVKLQVPGGGLVKRAIDYGRKQELETVAGAAKASRTGELVREAAAATGRAAGAGVAAITAPAAQEDPSFEQMIGELNGQGPEPSFDQMIQEMAVPGG